jgi:OmpA-OmpF porin, OOP family
MKMKLLLAAGALLASTSVVAQTSPVTEQTSDDLICQLSGDCGGIEQLEATEDKPESRGFKIARKTDAPRAASAPATSSVDRSRARVAADSPRASIAGATASAPGRNRTIAPKARPAPASIGRADLRMSFVTGSAELTPAGKSEALKFITALKSPALSTRKFRIEGHTDSVGSREANLELSKRRAQSVVDFLTSQGADPSKFEVQGYGPDKPLNGRDASSGANRRVEVVLIK